RSDVYMSGSNNFGSAYTSAASMPEKSYEELARCAASVVQIMVYRSTAVDFYGESRPFASGSGIMIGTSGYILTNCHVAKQGTAFGVKLENDNRIYYTNAFIKYHRDLDLALLRIDKRITPLPVYNGTKPLERGQRVVAIGSPMGMFNSVSDGIISGFRNINGVDMIQFTAPISAGSSGGALLNMYGEVIGISTAGVSTGQNLNLAVPYTAINNFCSGFMNR
ncbi:MAG: trypsin-like peptidase domain-containing protein, partial [Clostridia bacterium]|nr:trypsin-like peptidase domain-containing protein [Clostridia bacterium]